MKKLISLLSALTLCAGAIPFAASAEDLTYDVNEDGVVDKFDLAAVSTYLSVKDGTSDEITNSVLNDDWSTEEVLTKDYIGYDDDLEAKVLKNADFDKDGEITYKDTNIIFDYLFESGIYLTDANNDGKLTCSDAKTILMAYALFCTNTKDTREQAFAENEELASILHCSYFCDEYVTASDASYLLAYIIEKNVPGDVDYDGSADPTDAAKVLKYYAISSTLNDVEDYFTEEQANDISILGDANRDGAIDATDAALILGNYADAQTSK